MSEDQAAALILEHKAYRSLVHNYDWVIVTSDYGYGVTTRMADEDEAKVLNSVDQVLKGVAAK